jgi:protein involved in polysaccharide export with SLBB domain
MNSRLVLGSWKAAALLVAVALSAAAAGEEAAAQTPASDRVSADASDSSALRPGDLIRLRVWREPDLSGDFPVDEAGVAVLPEIGPLAVASTPANIVKDSIVRRLESYLTHPAVDVALLRRVQVTGAVQKPGLYHVDATMTVADALALAGGITSSGRSDRVEITREGQKLPGKVSGRTLISRWSVRSGDQLYVPERSWISRNPATILGALSALTAIVYTVSR